MNNGLIGYTGLVGSILKKKFDFNFFFNSKNISQIKGKQFDLIVCAGANAEKWKANKYPKKDKENILYLIESLKKIKCKKFILISTVDVFKIPNNVYENTLIDENCLNAYGYNRRLLEKFIEKNFKNRIIVRLPALVGPGLKKNIVFDFHNQHNINQIDSRHFFQFYPLDNLWKDIKIFLNTKIKLIHLTAEPVQVAEVAKVFSIKNFKNHVSSNVLNYNFKSKYSKKYFNKKFYNYSKKESLRAIKKFKMEEKKKI